MAEAISVEVVAPDRVWWSGAATQVSAPSVEGSIGILARHEPIFSVLQQGEVRIHVLDGGLVRFNVGGGFVSFNDNTVRIVADGVTEITD